MASTIKEEETEESSSIKKIQERIQESEGTSLPKEKLTPKPVQGLLSPSTVDQLVLAAKIDNTVCVLIQRLEANLDIIKKLIKLP